MARHLRPRLQDKARDGSLKLRPAKRQRPLKFIAESLQRQSTWSHALPLPFPIFSITSSQPPEYLKHALLAPL
jgi:hypothetical protein